MNKTIINACFVAGYFLAANSVQLQAQSVERFVIGSSGIDFSGSGISMSSTIGETVITTETAGTIILTQGFQQPDSVNIVSVQAIHTALNYKLYPNPTENISWLELSADNQVEVNLSLYDVAGRQVLQSKNIVLKDKHTEQLDLNHIAAGQYMLAIEWNGKKAITLNIQKIQ